MEELKIIMDSLAKVGNGAQVAFIAWCMKEVCVYLVCPVTFYVVGRVGYKISKEMQIRHYEHEDKRRSC